MQIVPIVQQRRSWGQVASGLPDNWNSMEIAVNPMDANDIYAMQNLAPWTFERVGPVITDAMWTGQSNRELLALGGRGAALFTSEGVYWFDNHTGGWTDASAGIPSFWAPLEGATHYASGMVRIADKGKGIWQAAIPYDLPPLAQPMTSSSEVFCASLQEGLPQRAESCRSSWLWSPSTRISFIVDRCQSSSCCFWPRWTCGCDSDGDPKRWQLRHQCRSGW